MIKRRLGSGLFSLFYIGLFPFSKRKIQTEDPVFKRENFKPIQLLNRRLWHFKKVECYSNQPVTFILFWNLKRIKRLQITIMKCNLQYAKVTPNTGMGAALQPNSHATVSVFFCFKLQVLQPSSLVNVDFSSEACFFIYNY